MAPHDVLYGTGVSSSANCALGLISSGAIGNAIDRAMKQSVTDFIRVYTENPTLKEMLINSPYGSAEWPSFNVADAAIVIGMGMFVIHWLFLEKDEDDDTEGSVPSPDAAASS